MMNILYVGEGNGNSNFKMNYIMENNCLCLKILDHFDIFYFQKIVN